MHVSWHSFIENLVVRLDHAAFPSILVILAVYAAFTPGLGHRFRALITNSEVYYGENAAAEPHITPFCLQSSFTICS